MSKSEINDFCSKEPRSPKEISFCLNEDFELSEAQIKIFCPDHAMTTVEMGFCANHEKDLIEKSMNIAYNNVYEMIKISDEKSRQTNPHLASFEAAQHAWIKYRDTDCGAVYHSFYGGSMAGAISIGCKINLTEERIHILKNEYCMVGVFNEETSSLCKNNAVVYGKSDYEMADKALNVLYMKIYRAIQSSDKNMPDDEKVLPLLKTAELNWIKYRDLECRKKNPSTGMAFSPLANNSDPYFSCLTKRTKERINALKNGIGMYIDELN